MIAVIKTDGTALNCSLVFAIRFFAVRIHSASTTDLRHVLAIPADSLTAFARDLTLFAAIHGRKTPGRATLAIVIFSQRRTSLGLAGFPALLLF